MPLDLVNPSRLIHNAKIYCFDDEDTIAEAMLIQSGRVLCVGGKDELRSKTKNPVEAWDLRLLGGVTTAGLVDRLQPI